MTKLLMLIVMAPGPRCPAKVTWTFDDGPCKATPRLVKVLGAHGERGMFFVLGARLQNPKYCQYLKDAVLEGHLVANHLWTHKSPCKIGKRRVVKELLRTERDIKRCLGHRRFTRAYRYIYRPPFGHTCHRQAVRLQGYRMMLWHQSDLYQSKRRMWRRVWGRLRRKKDVIVLVHYSWHKLEYLMRQLAKRRCVRR